MNNELTELVFILDGSGSMADKVEDTIGGFNSMIEKQKKEKTGRCLVSTVIFNNCSRVLHDRVPLGEVKPITRNEYDTNGCTALLDAVGGAIHHIGNVHKYARKDDVPGCTMFIITTDGMENASRHYSAERVRAMIEHEKTKHDWQFIFLAADLDGKGTAKDIGIAEEYYAVYTDTKEGRLNNFMAVNEAVSEVRSCRRLSESVWKKRLEGEED
ncbi:MAG: hypothetical protein IJ863_00450 [Spirochaetales bacterium]|nr:hypothetical protein [Spirochaetales bacterium]